MDAITRNNIFIENMELINRTMHRHRLLLFALHLTATMSIRSWLLPHCGPSNLSTQSVQLYQSPYLGQNCSTLF